MSVSKADATWKGTLREGAGEMSVGTGFVKSVPFTHGSRFAGATNGTNPEELIGAALAGCFSMFLASQLTNAGFPPAHIHTTATVHLEAGPTITKIELYTEANIPNIDELVFLEKVEVSKKNCPVSKALAAVPEVTVEAKLV